MELFLQFVGYAEKSISSNVLLSAEFSYFFIALIIIFLICKLLNVNFSHHHSKHNILRNTENISKDIPTETINLSSFNKFLLRGKGFNVPIIICFILFIISLFCYFIYQYKLNEFNQDPCKSTLNYLENNKMIDVNFNSEFIKSIDYQKCQQHFLNDNNKF